MAESLDARRNEKLIGNVASDAVAASSLPFPFTMRALQRCPYVLTIVGKDPDSSWVVADPATDTIRVERRLAAIVLADVVGYSRLMGRDEAGTLARLKAHLRELVQPLLAQHHGRMVKLMGDGALCEFASVVDAVKCSVEIQKGMLAREASRPENERIRFRVGINVGDIIVEEGDIYGDGVNIAARLQTLAEPGGIRVSRNVVNQVGNRLDIGFTPTGTHRVKNIAEPIETYAVGLRADRIGPRWRLPHAGAVAVALALLLLGAGGASAWRPSPQLAPAAASATLPD